MFLNYRGSHPEIFVRLSSCTCAKLRWAYCFPSQRFVYNSRFSIKSPVTPINSILILKIWMASKITCKMGWCENKSSRQDRTLKGSRCAEKVHTTMDAFTGAHWMDPDPLSRSFDDDHIFYNSRQSLAEKKPSVTSSKHPPNHSILLPCPAPFISSRRTHILAKIKK